MKKTERNSQHSRKNCQHFDAFVVTVRYLAAFTTVSSFLLIYNKSNLLMKDSNIAASKNYGDCSVHSCMIIRIIYHYWVIFFRSFVYSFIRFERHRNLKEWTDEENPMTDKKNTKEIILIMELQLRQRKERYEMKKKSEKNTIMRIFICAMKNFIV